jgi:hypothetical protein
MPGKAYPTDVLEQGQSVLDAWNQISKDLVFGDLTNAALTTDMAQAAPLQSDMNVLETRLTDLRNQRDALYLSIWDKVKRVRAGVKGIYGDDSSQYEMVGGTRLSERKTRTRKKKTAA